MVKWRLALAMCIVALSGCRADYIQLFVYSDLAEGSSIPFEGGETTVMKLALSIETIDGGSLEYVNYDGVPELPAIKLLSTEDATEAAPFDVIVSLIGGTVLNPELVLQRRARISFSDDDVVVPLPLCRRCADIPPCLEDETCVRGVCQSIELSDGDLKRSGDDDAYETGECD